jgi:hypothetical protein
MEKSREELLEELQAAKPALVKQLRVGLKKLRAGDQTQVAEILAGLVMLQELMPYGGSFETPAAAEVLQVLKQGAL